MAQNSYLTYGEYINYGGTKTAAEFVPLEFKARKAIDYMTDSRVQAMAEVPEAVKLCMLSIMSIISTTGTEAQATNPVVTSFTTDGYSENHGHAMNGAESSVAVNSTISEMLYGEKDDNGVPLLYRGLNTDVFM